jgi:hypothetical protein
MSIAEHFESRKQQSAAMIHQDMNDGGKRDATPQYIDGLRRAIADYREAAEIHRAVWQGASSRI